MKINLNGKIALVTGATGDLGRVISQTLGECGADVVVHYHSNEAQAEAVAEKIRAMGVRAFAVQADITSQASVKKMQQAVNAEFGEPDIIVTNAVIQYEPKESVLEQELTHYDSQYQSCVLQNVLMAQSFVPPMVRKRWGRVIGINTECSMLYNELHSAYVSGKRGMDGVLRVLAREVGPAQVTVNQVAPGFMISQRERDLNRYEMPWYDDQIPMRRRGTDQDIANAVSFLASDLAQFITGAFVPVCGGHVMPGI